MQASQTTNICMNFPTIKLITPCKPVLSYRRGVSVLLSALLIINTNFSPARANSNLQPFVAKYIAENDYVTGGKATLSLKQNDQGSYDFVLQTKPTGIFKWTGKGNIREQAVLPTLSPPFESNSYRYTDKGDSSRDYYIEFDRTNNEFQITRQAETLKQNLPSGALDRLSVTLVILNQLQKSTDFTSLDVNILNGTEAQKIVFTNQGAEQIATGIGQINALRIRKERESSNRETIIWLAQMENTDVVIPAKIEQFKRGKLTMRLILTGFSMVE